MNNLYFACADCKIYVDAGYRWAYWSLEEVGVVARGKPVRVEAVLAAKEYWTPSETESAAWLHKEVLPAARRFLHEHKRHRIIFGNTADFMSFDGEDFLDWMQVGFLPQLSPRYFAEYLGLMNWNQVCDFISKQDCAPWWWMLEWENLHDKVRRKFEQFVRERYAREPADC